MYTNPLALFREYVQNAVDAIDDAVAGGLLSSPGQGRIDITLDQAARRVVLRDNGTGLANRDFATTLLTFGASPKRGTAARGFRGVGRLAGLGHCQQLIFRSRARGDPAVMEIAWDGRTLKQLLATDAAGRDLATLVQQAVTVTTRDPDDAPAHFFEVELVRPRRIANDRLMNEVEIAAYLGQVAPCPFAPDFAQGAAIARLLVPHGRAGRTYTIHINDAETPVWRPHRNTIVHSETQIARLHTLEPFEIMGTDGGLAAVGWRVHHDYLGAIPARAHVRGLRVRIGNMQIGGERLLAGIFPEDRFGSWSIGEVHVLETRVVPNGRRDALDSGIHLDNIINHLRPIGSDIARRCRISSQKRNRRKAFAAAASRIEERLAVLKQGAVSEMFAATARSDMAALLAEMRKMLAFDLFDAAERKALKRQLAEIEAAVAQAAAMDDPDILQVLPADKQAVYQEVIDLIYACSENRVTAKALVDRILERL